MSCWLFQYISRVLLMAYTPLSQRTPFSIRPVFILYALGSSPYLVSLLFVNFLPSEICIRRRKTGRHWTSSVTLDFTSFLAVTIYVLTSFLLSLISCERNLRCASLIGSARKCYLTPDQSYYRLSFSGGKFVEIGEYPGVCLASLLTKVISRLPIAWLSLRLSEQLSCGKRNDLHGRNPSFGF